MKIGTRSVLFGVHQILIHPFFVFVAWFKFYGKFPTYKESLCIFFHDIGYLGKPNMDGEEGELHPELGGAIIQFILGAEYSDLTLYHSRAYAGKKGMLTSNLCIPDKLSILLYPKWLYILLGTLSGEITEYKIRMNMEYMSDLEWLNEVRSITYFWSYSHCSGENKKRVHAMFWASDFISSMSLNLMCPTNQS